MKSSDYRPYPRWPFTFVVLAIFNVLVIWVVLAIAALLDSSSTTEYLCVVSGSGVVVIALLSPLVLRRLRTRARSRTWLSRNEDALANLRAGKVGEAVDAWDTLARESKGAPLHHAIYCHNLAVGLMDAAEHEAAVALFRANLASGWPKVKALGELETKVHVMLALALALKGDLDDAERLRASLEPRLSAARKATTLLVDAVIAARRGRAPAFAPDPTLWRDAEAQLLPRHARALRAVLAFVARSSFGAAYRESPQSAEVDKILATSPPITAGEVDFLGRSWPEMQRFLEDTNLSSL